jgi:hypothetical protein
MWTFRASLRYFGQKIGEKHGLNPFFWGGTPLLPTPLAKQHPHCTCQIVKNLVFCIFDHVYIVFLQKRTSFEINDFATTLLDVGTKCSIYH